MREALDVGQGVAVVELVVEPALDGHITVSVGAGPRPLSIAFAWGGAASLRLPLELFEGVPSRNGHGGGSGGAFRAYVCSCPSDFAKRWSGVLQRNPFLIE